MAAGFGRAIQTCRGKVGTHACLIGLEGMVSKRSDSRYRSGTSRDWIKVKNPDHPAMRRVADAKPKRVR